MNECNDDLIEGDLRLFGCKCLQVFAKFHLKFRIVCEQTILDINFGSVQNLPLTVSTLQDPYLVCWTALLMDSFLQKNVDVPDEQSVHHQSTSISASNEAHNCSYIAQNFENIISSLLKEEDSKNKG